MKTQVLVCFLMVVFAALIAADGETVGTGPILEALTPQVADAAEDMEVAEARYGYGGGGYGGYGRGGYGGYGGYGRGGYGRGGYGRGGYGGYGRGGYGGYGGYGRGGYGYGR